MFVCSCVSRRRNIKKLMVSGRRITNKYIHMHIYTDGAVHLYDYEARSARNHVWPALGTRYITVRLNATGSVPIYIVQYNYGHGWAAPFRGGIIRPLR